MSTRSALARKDFMAVAVMTLDRDANGVVSGVVNGEALWCYTADAQPNPDADNIETACGWFVILPCGIERRAATCPVCRSYLEND